MTQCLALCLARASTLQITVVSSLQPLLPQELYMFPTSDLEGFMATYSDRTGVFSRSNLKELLMVL